MDRVVTWGLAVFVSADGVEAAAWVVGGQGVPDIETVERLARSQLSARRLGGRIRLVEVGEELLELLDLLGLSRELLGQAEGREEVVGVEEGMEPGDPAT